MLDAMQKACRGFGFAIYQQHVSAKNAILWFVISIQPNALCIFTVMEHIPTLAPSQFCTDRSYLNVIIVSWQYFETSCFINPASFSWINTDLWAKFHHCVLSVKRVRIELIHSVPTSALISFKYLGEGLRLDGVKTIARPQMNVCIFSSSIACIIYVEKWSKSPLGLMD